MSHGNVTCARVLPKDKVYRNIFDAECDMNKSLNKDRKVSKPKRESTLPVLKQPGTFTDGNGILSQRQRTWVQANPNEPYIENPTHYRYQRLDEQEMASALESLTDAQEVRGLPADNDSASEITPKSNVIEKIHESRKERHQAVLEELHQELGIISSDLEPRIVEASGQLKDELAANDKELLQQLETFADEEELINYTLTDLHNRWQDIAEISQRRQQCIAKLESTFSDIEYNRYDRVCETLKRFTATFELTAYLMPSDVHRMMEREAEEINSTIIRNRRCYADLIASLSKGAVEQERKHYHTWQTRLKTWKELKTTEAVEQFFDFMSSNDIKQPPEILHQLDCMRKEQDTLNLKRIEILNGLREMKPPGSTKAAVYQWNSALGHVTDQLDKVYRKYKDILENQYDQVIEKCYERMEQTKTMLEENNVIGGEELYAILNESFLPLVGEKKTRYETEMDIFERTLENLATFQDNRVRSLFKFVQGAAHIWDIHEIGIAKQERALQEELDERRHRHDGANQVKEANLDIIMDRMRQDSNKEALSQSLANVFTLLEEIQNGYKLFHTSQLECVRKYPYGISDELERYDQDVCSYFGVERNKGQARKSQQPQQSPPQQPQPQQPQPQQQRRAGGKTRSPRLGVRVHRETSSYATALEEVLKTSNGTTFYVMTHCQADYDMSESVMSVRSLKTSMTFLTDQQDLDDYNTLYTEKITLDEEMFMELRKNLRMQFLESLEQWRTEAMERANSVVAAKVEELNSELDLRLHLHRPRPARAEQDIHNVRAAELLMHQERVDRHSKGILATLSEFKHRFQSMIEEHNDETETFKRTVHSLEATFTTATKTHELVSIQDQVSGQVEEYMNKIRTSLRKFRHDLDGMLSSLRNSNARFRKSFKVFSEGGNYSLDEIEDYRKKLERMANKIDQSEGSIMGELEGMESKRLEAAMEYAGKLEDRFKHHLFDLTFIEKISRWITNTQVNIKSEVAKSNSQAKRLAGNLKTLERHIDAVRNPNLDKEQVSAEDVKEELCPLFALFVDRAVFLKCLLIEPASCYAALAGTGYHHVVQETDTNVKNGQKKDSDRRLITQRMGSLSKDSSCATLSTEYTTPSGEPRPQTMPALENDRAGQTFKHSAHSFRNHKSSVSRRHSGVKREFLRFDKKYLVFGDKSENDTGHFLGCVTKILRHSLEGILATSEAYYRQKGPRPCTRPEIHDNFDTSAQAMVQRLTSYKTQATDYHNSCILEVRDQLKKLVSLVVDIPDLIIQSFVLGFASETDNFVARTKKDNTEMVDMLDQRKKQHESFLRPTLGHPKNRDELDALKNAEKERAELQLKNLKNFTGELKGHAVERAGCFVKNLSQISTELLQLFDAMVCVDDVQKGKIEAKPKSTKQILVERTKPAQKEVTVPEYSSKAGGEWQGLPTNELVLCPSRDLTRTPSTVTSKTTAGHVAVLEARNKAYKKYKSEFFGCLNKINEEEKNSRYEEERWVEKWTKSLEKIQNLY